MDQLLHRGAYAIKDDEVARVEKNDSIFTRLGFSASFTKGDYLIAILSLVWPFIWLVVFILGVLFRHRIDDTLWFEYWYYWMWGMYVFGIVITIWLTWGGLIDMKDFIKRLKEISRGQETR